MPHFPPPPPLPPKMRRFQRVPPAIFPPLLGLLGLGIAWRRGAGAFGMPEGAVELYLGAVSLLFLFSLGCYALKIRHRAGVVAEDLATVPGRGGLAAMTMCVMLFAAVMVPYEPLIAALVLWLGLAGHLAMVLALIRFFLAPSEGPRTITPVIHLVFSGVIVAPIALIPLGFPEVARLIVWVVLGTMTLVYILTLPGLLTGDVPVPLRPLQAIHLAPPSLLATASFALGRDGLGVAMLALACLITLALVLRLRWMLEGPFSGFWSAFTFPVAAFAGAWLSFALVTGLRGAEITGAIVLVVVTLTTPLIARKVMKAWADGTLAAKTNAAIA